MKFIYQKLVLVLIVLSGCSKSDEVAMPDFEVSTTSSTFKKGVPVVFTFRGNPQLISVYTGETGKDYAYKDGRVMDVSSLNLSFNSAVTNGGTGSPQTGMFTLMVSTDFNGDYSSISSVENATWTDVTSRMSKQEAATTSGISAATPAGGMSLTDLRVAGKPFFIAFKYNIRQQSIYGAWRTWTFQAFNLTATGTAGTQVLGSMTTTAFRVVQKNPEIISRTAATTTVLTLQHADLALTPGAAEIPTQNWVITQGFTNTNKIDYGPDLAIPIQGGTNGADKKNYAYTFANAGNYKVYFVAANASLKDRKEVVRSLDITITD
ncbi:hypothetical protein ABIE26_000264 [Pedobacter africanus]|uniref:Uncharacterized protein n=1 Tax=Pedobacter africanus TaxID=151894 RepID=A0ACC6KVU2_9SPHI|nr:DUF5017 domain-containing protein [Pedobacter africanus]MDR6783248.1 hypothetical protein [Pedobacter africanus]